MGYLSFGRSCENCARQYHIPYISDHLSNIWYICLKTAKIKKMWWMKDTELFLVLRHQLYTSDSFLQNMPQIWFSWQMIWPEQSCRMSNNLQLKWPIFRHLSTFFMNIVDVNIFIFKSSFADQDGTDQVSLAYNWVNRRRLVGIIRCQIRKVLRMREKEKWGSVDDGRQR